MSDVQSSILIPLDVVMNDNFVEYRLEDGKLVYKSEVNYLAPDSGMVVENIEFPVPAYYVKLSDAFGVKLDCGNVVTTFFTAIKSVFDNRIIIIDFEDIDSVSNNFCKEYYKYLLTTKNKVITINQSVNVSNVFARFILSNTKLEEVSE